MNDIESAFLVWAARGLLVIVGGLFVWLAIRLWNKAHEQTPAEIAALRNELLVNYATKDTVLRMDRELDEKLRASDAQRMLFHGENTKKLDEIALMTQAIYKHATDLGRIDERVKALEARLGAIEQSYERRK